MPEELDPLCTAHLAWLVAQNDVAPNTVKARRAVLRSLPNAGTATREEVEAWWESRAHLARATRIADLSHLRRLYRWARIWEHRADDPTLRIDAPRKHQGIPRPLGRSDIRKLLDTLPDDLRRATALGALAGLRVSESANLMWSEVDFGTRRLRIVESKGGKTRLVGINAQLEIEIRPEGEGSVVTGGKPYAVDTLTRKLNRAMTAAGVKGTSHQLRHYWASSALAATGDLLAVSRSMGHSSTAVTAVYTALSDDALDTVAAGVRV